MIADSIPVTTIRRVGETERSPRGDQYGGRKIDYKRRLLWYGEGYCEDLVLATARAIRNVRRIAQWPTETCRRPSRSARWSVVYHPISNNWAADVQSD